jgi:DNA-binding protein Fis
VAELLEEEHEAEEEGVVIDKERLLRLYCPDNPDDVVPVQEIYAAYLQHVLGLFEGNITRTAKVLDIAPNTLRKHLMTGE